MQVMNSRTVMELSGLSATGRLLNIVNPSDELVDRLRQGPWQVFVHDFGLLLIPGLKFDVFPMRSSIIT